MELDNKIITILANNEEIFAQSAKKVSEDYFDGPYREIYKLLKSFFKKYQKLPPADLLEKKLRDNSEKLFKNSKENPESIILSIVNNTSLVKEKDFDFLLGEIKERNNKKVLTEMLPEVVEGAKENDYDKVKDKLKDIINRIQKNDDSSFIEHTSNHDYMETLKNNYEKAKLNPEGVYGIKTGFKLLDESTLGLRPSTMTAIGARHAAGKSVFLLNVAINAFKQGKNVVIFSLEMPAKQYWDRAISCYTKIPISNIERGCIPEEDEYAFYKALEELQNSAQKLEIIDAPLVNSITITTELKSLSFIPDLLVIDYLGIVRPSDSKKPDHLAIGETCEELRTLARQLNIPLLTAVQLNRSSEKGSQRAKDTARASRSDQIGATLDCFLQIAEVDTSDQLAQLSDKTEIFVVKNRGGKSGFSFPVRKNFACSSFEEYDENEF